jgi:hypothetical protein
MSYIPGKEADFVEWSENLIAVSTDNKTVWKLPEDKLAELVALHTEVRRALRIPIRDTKPTPHPAPDTIPEIEVETPHPRVVRIRFRDEHAARWGKPQYVHGFDCAWIIAGVPPELVKDLAHSEFATRTPPELAFEENERGKRVYFAGRWETGAVKKGRWSDILSAVIP